MAHTEKNTLPQSLPKQGGRLELIATAYRSRPFRIEANRNRHLEMAGKQAGCFRQIHVRLERSATFAAFGYRTQGTGVVRCHESTTRTLADTRHTRIHRLALAQLSN